MPVLRNGRHENFAQQTAAGKSTTDAYLLAGYKSSRLKARQHGYRLKTREDITARIQELIDKPQGRIATQQIVEATRTGRPTIYRPELATLARKLALLGATESEMADLLNIHESTLSNWMGKHSEFSSAVKSGKLQADAEVAERLFSRATGHSHEAMKIFMPAGAEAPVYAPFTAHYPPDTKAALAWLSRRQPGLWRKRQEVDVTATVAHRIAQMTPDQGAQHALDLAERVRARLAEYRQTIEHEPAPESEPEE
jgi:hypothetical protein